jgi:hypothetical protein
MFKSIDEIQTNVPLRRSSSTVTEHLPIDESSETSGVVTSKNVSEDEKEKDKIEPEPESEPEPETIVSDQEQSNQSGVVPEEIPESEVECDASETTVDFENHEIETNEDEDEEDEDDDLINENLGVKVERVCFYYFFFRKSTKKNSVF